MRSRALCAVLVTVLVGVDAAKQSQTGEKSQSVRDWSSWSGTEQATATLVDVLSSNATQALFQVCHLARSFPAASPLHVEVPQTSRRMPLCDPPPEGGGQYHQPPEVNYLPGLGPW
jgi:hypothetical protein